MTSTSSAAERWVVLGRVVVFVRVGAVDAGNARRVDEQVGVDVLREGGPDGVGGLGRCDPAHNADVVPAERLAGFLVIEGRCGHGLLA